MDSQKPASSLPQSFLQQLRNTTSLKAAELRDWLASTRIATALSWVRTHILQPIFDFVGMLLSTAWGWLKAAGSAIGAAFNYIVTLRFVQDFNDWRLRGKTAQGPVDGLDQKEEIKASADQRDEAASLLVKEKNDAVRGDLEEHSDAASDHSSHHEDFNGSGESDSDEDHSGHEQEGAPLNVSGATATKPTDPHGHGDGHGHDSSAEEAVCAMRAGTRNSFGFGLSTLLCFASNGFGSSPLLRFGSNAPIKKRTSEQPKDTTAVNAEPEAGGVSKFLSSSHSTAVMKKAPDVQEPQVKEQAIASGDKTRGSALKIDLWSLKGPQTFFFSNKDYNAQVTFQPALNGLWDVYLSKQSAGCGAQPIVFSSCSGVSSRDLEQAVRGVVKTHGLTKDSHLLESDGRSFGASSLVTYSKHTV